MIAMPTLLMFCSRFCAVTMISLIPPASAASSAGAVCACAALTLTSVMAVLNSRLRKLPFMMPFSRLKFVRRPRADGWPYGNQRAG
ncbi:hypothetical protein [Novosphingobium sp.]|uniref:hypothetical protein n=1 Tax=Novosphingobium sp. TaxID=1874826 RepID=UPI001EC831FB|nr:hypothetical protein [Novosphingobium sp.]MBK9010183.1 hypothetical protein [Novosphingobium sp.]